MSTRDIVRAYLHAIEAMDRVDRRARIRREMRAQICSVIELRDGKIWRQEHYDCF